MDDGWTLRTHRGDVTVTGLTRTTRTPTLAFNHGRQMECDFRGLIQEPEDQL